MKMKRRTFLAESSGTLLGFLGLDLRPCVAGADRTVVKRGNLTTTICPYCAVGCGAIVTASAWTVARNQVLFPEPRGPMRKKLCFSDLSRRFSNLTTSPSFFNEI